MVETTVGHQHAWISGTAVALVQRPSFEENGVGVATRVAGVRLIDLNFIVSQVIVHDQVDAGTVQSRVVPVPLEAQDLAVVQQELLELLVGGWLADLELRERLRIHRLRRDRQTAFLGSLGELVRLLPQVLDHGLVLADIDAILLVEPAREAVAACDLVRASVDMDLLPAAQVVRTDEAHSVGPRHSVALEEHALGDAAVLDLRLRELQGAILHIIHEGHLTVAAVLVRSLGDMLLKEAVEAQNLLVVLHPRRGNAGLPHVPRNHVLEGGCGCSLRHLGHVALTPAWHPQLLGCRDVELRRGADLELVNRPMSDLEVERRLAPEVCINALGHRSAQHHDAGQGLGL
mmetsp:Transcript_61414/g.155983  ORF Transcript_61414/g.155983 Transcript_61414/m.155983 type:complete len:346 (-) Transcript_61414:92-1129(-)